MFLIPGPCCLNCEKQKKVQQPITLGSSSGYICDECYNSNIWANEDNQRSHSLLNLLLHTKLYNSKRDGT